jgi:glycosyltransferase involved in cell wall biosynthesis
MKNFKLKTLVSIIIPTFNSEENIKRCLETIKKQDYKNIEVIIVDQYSSDKTVEIGNKYGVNVYLLEKPPFYTPPTKSRNFGASKAKGEYILHLDSDMELQKDTISKCVECMRQYDAVVIHEIDVTHGFWGKAKALERACYVGNLNIEAARFVKKSLFIKVKGYDEKISSGEDWDIDSRYKKYGKVGDSGAYLYHHSGSLDLVRQLKKKFSYGRTSHLYMQKDQGKVPSLMGEMFKSYGSNFFKLLSDPLHAVGFLLLRFFEMGAVSLGILWGKYAGR